MSGFEQYRKDRQKELGYKKGREFENRVEQLHNKYDFRLLERTHPFEEGKRIPQSVTDPDLKFQDLLSKEIFWVECKFRARLVKNQLDWTTYTQLKHYQDFAKRKKQPVFIVVGLGGTPGDPERMYVIPLEKADYCRIDKDLIKPFERRPDKEFTFFKGHLL